MEKVLPTVLIALQVLSSGPYFYQGDWKMGLSFSSLWQSIYGQESLERNDWVWVIDFKVIEG